LLLKGVRVSELICFVAAALVGRIRKLACLGGFR
jgi:hypothetical protein